MEVSSEKSPPLVYALPAELLEKIFLELPIRNLPACRLVSRFWKIIGTHICRKRYVRFQDWHLHSLRTLADLNGVFRKSDTFPCSSYTLSAANEDDIACRRDSGARIPTGEFLLRARSSRTCIDGMTPIVVYNVMRIVGGEILRLNSGGFGNQFQCILDGLEFTPNLEVLCLSFWVYWCYRSKFHIPTIPTIQLPRLKSLKIEFIFEAAQVELLDFLIRKAGVRLEKIELGVIGFSNWLDESAARMALLINRIPSISLDFEYRGTFQFLQGFINNPVRLQSVSIRVSDYESLRSPRDPFFRCLEQFLTSISESLETFSYKVGLQRNVCRYPLKVPNLPHVKILKFWLHFGFGERLGDLHPFKTNQFPVLESLLFSSKCKFVFKTLFDNSHFDSVNELFMYNHETDEVQDWNRIFPNLKKLCCEIRTSSFVYIVANLQKLESLTVFAQEKIQNLNILLTGIENLEVNVEEAEGSLNPETILSEHPSLLLFRALKRLILVMDKNEVPECVIRRCFLQLPRLESLKLKFIRNISVECESSLRTHHQRVARYC